MNPLSRASKSAAFGAVLNNEPKRALVQKHETSRRYGTDTHFPPPAFRGKACDHRTMTVEDIPDASADATSPNAFEAELSKAANKVVVGTKTGYAWQEVDQIVAEELEADGLGAVATRCKKANGSGRAANVLTESNDKDIDLYLIFCKGTYDAEKFRRVAADRIRRFPKVVNVAVFTNKGTAEDPLWTIAELIHRSDQTLPTRLMNHFPTLTKDKLVEVPASAEGERTQIADAMVDQTRFADLAQGVTRSMEKVSELPDLFAKLAAQRGISLDQATVFDVLACALSSHLLLFAGPSGTGKSALARLLAEFFVPPESFAVVEARRGWLGPEDVAGYYSALTAEFAATADTETFLLLHEACQGLLDTIEGDSDSVFSPILLVEEANMSVVEAYLAPVTHGLSGTSVSTINWSLHNSAKEHTFGVTEIPIPQALQFGPWPRVFATINVDSTSPAPARKVTGRGLVVLLEPREMEVSADTAASILASAGTAENEVESFPENVLGNPSAVLKASSEQELTNLLGHLYELLNTIEYSSRFQPSRRDLNRAALYMCWYVRLCEKIHNVDALQIGKWAAQNAFLHVFLPQMAAKEFNAAVTTLIASKDLLATSGGLDLGVLQARLVRLERARTAQVFPESVDFWASLS
ncbi:hypothetical protein [Arthrobacter cupressi]